jgi:NO-binding membrane sensor protein with MHYT domain
MESVQQPTNSILWVSVWIGASAGQWSVCGLVHLLANGQCRCVHTIRRREERGCSSNTAVLLLTSSIVKLHFTSSSYFSTTELRWRLGERGYRQTHGVFSYANFSTSASADEKKKRKRDNLRHTTSISMPCRCQGRVSGTV